MKKVLLLIAALLLIGLAGCQHPLVGASDTFVNKTVGPYCEDMVKKHEKDELRAKLILDNIRAFRRAVEEAKNEKE